MNTLAAIQGSFQHYVLGEVEAEPAIAAAVLDQFGLPARDRLAIYHHAYRARIREALAEAFGKTWTYLGDDMFEQLVGGYLAAHPSQERNLRWYGAGFADYLVQALPDYPFVAELARFEWALGIAFDAADCATLNAHALRALAPDAWGALRFGLHPSVQLLVQTSNAVALWQALAQDAEPPDAHELAAGVTWLVWRAGLQPHFRSLDALEATALTRLAQGASFGEVCEEAAAAAPATETKTGTGTESKIDTDTDTDTCGAELTLALAGCLQNWLAQGLLTALPQ